MLIQQTELRTMEIEKPHRLQMSALKKSFAFHEYADAGFLPSLAKRPHWEWGLFIRETIEQKQTQTKQHHTVN